MNFQSEKEGKSSKGEGTLNKLLVFEMERSQIAIVKYSKKSNQNLMSYFKRSIARAFRVDEDTVNNLKKKRKSPEPVADEGK